MKLKTIEKGMLDVLAIRESAEGTWEDDWDSVRGTLIGNLFSRVSRADLNHVLAGYSKPFVEALGVPPEGALVKLPSEQCEKQRRCPLFQPRKCRLPCKKLPWCFEPAGLNLEPTSLRVAGEAVSLWRERVYVTIIHG